MRLADKVALLTGVGSGMGRDSALLFADNGASVMGTDTCGDSAAATAAEVSWRGREARRRAMDVTREEDVEEAVAAKVESLGKLSVLHSNAGIQVPSYPIKDVQEVAVEQWKRTFDMNVMGAFFACKHAIPALRASGGGSVVVMSSATAIASARRALLRDG